ncbi:hypothetical protein F511_28277 [Dorcoceras hygrometricum]|uniref:Uncharacterized protein n=1 Tax=Dorcoceras hygrometricum TaxID=472368 RepID=A0A2Z7DES6_9LAMI|nr:hypothetical protein F511_28277 [Dorcoceras hygrometricum]
MVKRLATSSHDPLGITDSVCKNHLVVVSVQYGPFNPYIPIISTTIGKSRVAKDPIAMLTSWRSNSDIASVTSIGYPRMSASGESSTTMHRLLHASGSHPIPTPYDPKTNQYNQDLGLIHSTNGNHLESPKEGSSIYHQGPSNADPPPAKPTQATTQGPKHRKATTGSYELNQRYPTPYNSTESSKKSKQGSQQEESNATTLTSIGALYHRKSKKIRFEEQHDQQRNLGNLKQHIGNKHQPQRDLGVKTQYGEQHKQHKESNNKYANAMKGIKATTERREPKDRNNSSTARSDQRNNRQWPRGILSTWELPTHHITPYQMLNKQLHLLLPTHEMWELPTPLIAANKPSRKMRYHPGTHQSTEQAQLANRAEQDNASVNKLTSVPQFSVQQLLQADCHNDADPPPAQRQHTKPQGPKHRKQQLGVTNSTSANPTSLTHQKTLNKLKGRNFTYPKNLGAKSDAYANRLHKGDVFAHLTSFKQTFKKNIQTKHLSKRSPTLPLSLSSELSTVDNRRR